MQPLKVKKKKKIPVDTYPLVMESKNFLFFSSVYSLRGPSSMLKPFFHIFKTFKTTEHSEIITNQNFHKFMLPLELRKKILIFTLQNIKDLTSILMIFIPE